MSLAPPLPSLSSSPVSLFSLSQCSLSLLQQGTEPPCSSPLFSPTRRPSAASSTRIHADTTEPPRLQLGDRQTESPARVALPSSAAPPRDRLRCRAKPLAEPPPGPSSASIQLRPPRPTKPAPPRACMHMHEVLQIEMMNSLHVLVSRRARTSRHIPAIPKYSTPQNLKAMCIQYTHNILLERRPFR